MWQLRDTAIWDRRARRHITRSGLNCEDQNDRRNCGCGIQCIMQICKFQQSNAFRHWQDICSGFGRKWCRKRLLYRSDTITCIGLSSLTVETSSYQTSAFSVVCLKIDLISKISHTDIAIYENTISIWKNGIDPSPIVSNWRYIKTCWAVRQLPTRIWHSAVRVNTAALLSYCQCCNRNLY